MQARLLKLSCAVVLFSSGLCTSASHAYGVHPTADEAGVPFALRRTGMLAAYHADMAFRRHEEAVAVSCASALAGPREQGRISASRTGSRLLGTGVGMRAYEPAVHAALPSGPDSGIASGVRALSEDNLDSRAAPCDSVGCPREAGFAYASLTPGSGAAAVTGRAWYARRDPQRVLVATVRRRPLCLLVGSGLIGWLGIGRRKSP